MEKLRKLIMKYNERFPDGFPSVPLLIGNGPDWCAKIIARCLEANKDVYEMGYADDPSEDIDVKY